MRQIRATLKYIKKIILDIFLDNLDKHRYGINTHLGDSREITVLYEDTSYSNPNKVLLELVSKIYKDYIDFSNNFIAPRFITNFKSEMVWEDSVKKKTGEHYILIPLIIKLINASNFFEIGTFQGASSKSVLLNSNAKIQTVDLKKWNKFKGSFLEENDFFQKKIKQHIIDLSLDKNFKKFEKDLLKTDLIFLDGPKNYNFEKTFLEKLFYLYKNNPENSVFVLIDDIKLSTMCKIWKTIKYPKCNLDIIGHWSGSGIIYISN